MRLRKIGFAFAAFTAVFILYLLSIGPVAWLHEMDVISDESMHGIVNLYAPFLPFDEDEPPLLDLERPISLYVDWWREFADNLGGGRNYSSRVASDRVCETAIANDAHAPDRDEDSK